MNQAFKKVVILILVLVLSFCFTACNMLKLVANIDDLRKPSESVSPSLQPATPPPVPVATPEPVPTILPTATPIPTPAPFGEVPDHAGSGEVLFDIYKNTALVDLNSDGTPEELTFTVSKNSATLQIDSKTYKIDRENLAQTFAVTDIDISDGILELAFTDRYSDELADTEFPFTYLYWWNGEKLISMGGLMNMKFDGPWRSSFNPVNHLDAHGMVMCLTRTQNFSDVWYTGHYVPKGEDRKLKEDLYVADVLFHQDPLELIQDHMLLLKKISNTYFDFSYAVIWDYASNSGGYAGKSRGYSDEIVAFIPQMGEKLTITKVYGKKWFKLQAADGKSGWLKCENMKVYGYWPVMGDYFSAYDLFDGIVVAG